MRCGESSLVGHVLPATRRLARRSGSVVTGTRLRLRVIIFHFALSLIGAPGFRSCRIGTGNDHRDEAANFRISFSRPFAMWSRAPAWAANGEAGATRIPVSGHWRRSRSSIASWTTSRVAERALPRLPVRCASTVPDAPGCDCAGSFPCILPLPFFFELTSDPSGPLIKQVQLQPAAPDWLTPRQRQIVQNFSQGIVPRPRLIPNAGSLNGRLG